MHFKWLYRRSANKTNRKLIHNPALETPRLHSDLSVYRSSQDSTSRRAYKRIFKLRGTSDFLYIEKTFYAAVLPANENLEI